MLQRPYTRMVPPLLAFVIGIAFLNAWVADDASITLRTIFHFLNGYGPNFNADIRVQSYTHPLWMLLLSLFIGITQEYYFTTIFVSLACTAGALFLMSRLADHTQTLTVVAALAILSLSKSFIEYSTSGLENPLGYLLLTALCVVIYRRDHIAHPMRWLGIILAGIVLNRQDYVLLVAPLVLFAAIAWRTDTARPWQPHVTHTLRNFANMSVGLVPLILWFGFSTLYYGSPLPNTAYAKLNTFIDSDALMAQGVLYVLNTIKADPLVLGIIGMAVISAWIGRQPMAYVLIAGVGLYGFYVVSIGGDFMVGRFFTGIIIVSMMTIIISKPTPTLLWGITAPLLLVGIFHPLNPWFMPTSTTEVEMKQLPSGVIDERQFYSTPTEASVALFNQTRYGILNPYIYINRSTAQVYKPRQSEHYINCDCTGTMGITLGPEAVLIDNYGLFDPLIARLPATYTPYWRTGHFRRTIPIGYMESLQSGRNMIADPEVAALYDALHLITQGPLWSAERIAAIVRLNTGYYDSRIDTFSYQFPDAVHVYSSEIAYLTAPTSIPIGLGGLAVHVETPSIQPMLSVTHRGDISWNVWFYKGKQRVAALSLPKQTNSDALLTSTLTIPETIRQSGYDTIHFLIDLDAYENLLKPAPTSALGRVALLDAHTAILPSLANATMEYNSTHAQPARISMTLRWDDTASVVTNHDVSLTHNEQEITVIPDQIIDGTTVWSTETTLAPGLNRFGVIATSNGIRIPAPDVLEFTITPTMAVATALDVDPASLPVALGSGWYDQDAQWSVTQADLHTRWYRLALSARGRWAQSPQFQVFTPESSTYTLDLAVAELVQAQGLAASAPFELNVNGTSQPVTLQKGANRFDIALQAGMNTVQLRATNPGQSLATLIPGSNDGRMVDMRIIALAVMQNTP